MDLQQAFDAGFEQVKEYIDAELGFIKSQLPLDAVPGPQGPPGDKGEPGRDADALMLPPELAKQLATVVRLLHETSPIEAVAKAVVPPPKLVRIDRDEAGSFLAVYDETRP